MKAGSALNNFSIIDNLAYFFPFLHPPKSDILDFINSSSDSLPTGCTAADDNNEVDISFEREKNSEPKI